MSGAVSDRQEELSTGDTEVSRISFFDSIVRSEMARSRPAFISAGFTHQDVVQECWVAVFEARTRFDQHQGLDEGAYIRLSIRNALMRLRRRLDPMPETMRRDHRLMGEARAAGSDTDREVSFTRTRIKEVERVAELSSGTISVDDVFETLPPQHLFPQPEAWALTQEWRISVRAALNGLPEREREAVLRRVIRQEPITQVAAALGVSPGRISQLVAQGIRRMRDALSDWEVAR